MFFLSINKEESRIIILFNIYMFVIIKVNVFVLNFVLLNIEVNVVIVKKIMGVSSKNMKFVMIFFLKLCLDKEMVKKFRMLNRVIVKRRIINILMLLDILLFFL